ncbi:MAG TPA: aminotransferase class III-fold pyridoxal phosphate-dependent enzyme, partial [Pseudomonas sp.]|nr:aminotransferase class III-fold pyridoxal phosphate-dependent enzyme [Pseudomonas sp.]
MRDDWSRDRLMNTVQRPEQLFVRGQGSWLWDAESRSYLDFTQGWAVNSLGHSPVALVRALQRQAGQLINPGPAYYNRGMLELAARLCQATGSDQAYFLNSGAEANEGAIKLARKWGQLHRGGAYRMVTAVNSFHGRTLGAMSASGKPAFQALYEPKVPGFAKVPYNDLAALEAALGDDVVALMLEPVQGEAGVLPAELDYLQGAERLCRKRGILLILDEVQTGIGRCGSLLAEELYGIRADVITLGKGLGGGVPLAALLARGNACCFAPGEQGGTYHGNALMTAAGLAVLDVVLEPGLLEQVRATGQQMRDGLARVG